MNICTNLKNLAGAILLCSLPATAYAAQLSPQQAMARVQSSQAIHRMPGSQSLALAHTEKANGENYLYVFNRGTAGFVIASADDSMPAVLGYSDNGAFDPANASPELKWWLEQYAAQADSFLKSGSTQLNAPSSPRHSHPKVAELLTTRWNQAEPYNLLCPVDNGITSVTGCVATAMAQVIKFHGYPVNGNGDHSYNWKGQTLSYDYSSANFDYANMLNEYEYYIPSTEAQNQAVANLMYACGVGVNTNYGYGGSGAFSIDIAYALTEYFGYDKEVRFLKRDYFSAEDWENIMYEEVAAGRPVIYGGQSAEGGHEFVCDGYEDGYFHINWGWSGMGNGWFLLSALDPGIQGIGGGDGGYNYNQEAIIGIRPDAGNPQTTYPIMASGGLVPGSVLYNRYVDISFSGDGLVINYSPVQITTDVALMAVSSSGEETMANGYSVSFPAAFGGQLSGYPSLRLSVPSVGQGNYTVYLMYKGPQGDWQRVPTPLTGANHLDMSVDADGNVSFSQGIPELQPKIKVTQLEPLNDVLPGVETTFKISMENIGDYPYSGVVHIRTYKPESEDMLSEVGFGLNLSVGGTASGTLGLTYNLPDGVYVQRCYDMYGEVCSDDFQLVIGHPAIEAAGITLDITEKTITEGESFTLTATIDPENTTDKTITWSSSDPAVAKVENGVVTAVAPGSATITATTANGLKATCAVTVKAKIIEAAGITLDITEKTITEGESFTLTATIDPENTTDKTITWSSSDPAVAKVENGVVTAVAPGSATITATTANGLKATCAVTVKAKIIEAAGITLDITEKTITEGESFTLTATIDPENTTDKTITWSSSDPAVATVENGVVTAVAPGTATITATTANGLKATCAVTVKAKIIEAAGITLDITEKTITEGESFTLTATIDPENTTDKTITWSSSDPAVATVENGVVTAVAPGTATITASTANGLKATCAVTVKAKIIEAAGITLDITEKTITEGESFTLTATIDPENTTDKTITWSSSDPAVATVENGVVTAVAPGTATITATTANGLNATCTVIVEAKLILATSITLDQTSVEAPIGTIVKLVATVLPDDTTDKTVAWSTSDASIATVDNEGNVTIVANGTATITASTTDGSDLHAECTISGLTSLETLMKESGPVDIYTLGGLLIRKDAGARDFDTLAKGIYIIRSATSTYKIMK